jgi:hypothetical protein
MRPVARLGMLTVPAVLLASTALGQSPRSVPSEAVAAHLSVLGFTLGKSTLDDVTQKLGPSPVRRCLPGDSESKEVCYVSSGYGPETVVVFEAGFSGGWSELDGYKIISGPIRPSCDQQCPAIAVGRRDIRSGGGLRLGLTRREVLTLLGTPIRSTRDRLEFQWLSCQPMTREETEREAASFKSPVRPYFDVQDTIEVTLSQSRVVRLDVHHVVSY